MFPDGRPYVLTFNQVEQRYYAAFVDEFPEADVSISQWRGGYEYQTLYPAIQMMVENGIMTLDALNEILGVIAATNQSIYRPAVLQSRVAERFAQAGYEATARVADINTRGIVAICVDQERTSKDYHAVFTPDAGGAAGFPDDIGWRNGAFGGLESSDGNFIFKNEFVTLTTQPGAPDIIFDFAGPQTLPGFQMTIGGVVVDFVQYAGSPTQAYRATSAEAYELIRGSVGVGLSLFVAGGGSFEAVNNDDDLIGNLIRDELLPAGQHMEGDVTYPTALSNGQPLDIRWRIPAKTTHEFRTTIQRARGSQYPMHSVDEIIILFNANYAEQMGIGRDITPATYLTTSDLKWAAVVTTEWSADGGATWASTIKTAQYFDQFLAELDPANVVIV